MKSRPFALRILAAFFALALLVILFFFYNAFNGNPVSAAIVTARVHSYVDDKWPKEGFSISWANYDFKTGLYSCHVSHPESPDTSFRVSGNITGSLYDNYELAVIQKENTYFRLQQEMDNQLSALLREETGFPFRMLYCSFSEKEGQDRSRIHLDMEFQLSSLPYPVCITAYTQTDNETPSWEEMAQKLLVLSRTAKNHGLSVSTYSFCLEGPYSTDEKGNLTVTDHDLSLSVFDFPASLLEEENLPEILREFSQEGEK